jgi:hypothetical protein
MDEVALELGQDFADRICEIDNDPYRLELQDKLDQLIDAGYGDSEEAIAIKAKLDHFYETV